MAATRTPRTPQEVTGPTNLPRNTRHPSGVIIFFGLAFLLFALMGILFEVATSEALINSAPVNAFKPDWSLFTQLIDLVQGNLTVEQGQAAFVGWTVELVYLAMTFLSSVLRHSVQRSGQTMAGWFNIIGWVIIGYQILTDFNYGTLGSGFVGHLGFAVAIFVVVGFFPNIGLYLVQCGWKSA